MGAPTARQEAIPIAVVRTNSPPSLGDPSQDRTRWRLLFMVAVTTNEVAEEAQRVGRLYARRSGRRMSSPLSWFCAATYSCPVRSTSDMKGQGRLMLSRIFPGGHRSCASDRCKPWDGPQQADVAKGEHRRRTPTG